MFALILGCAFLVLGIGIVTTAHLSVDGVAEQTGHVAVSVLVLLAAAVSFSIGLAQLV